MSEENNSNNPKTDTSGGEANIPATIDAQQKEIDKINRNLWYVILIIGVMFLAAMLSMGVNVLVENSACDAKLDEFKEITITQQAKMNQQQIEINNLEAEINRLGNELKKEIELLRAKNPYLK